MHRLVSFGLAAVGGLLLWKSISLEVGTLSAPGPGLWPAIVSAVLTACALVLAVTESSPEEYEGFGRRTLVVLLALVSMGLYIVAFSVAGYLLPTLVMLVVWLRFIARESWRLTLVFGIGCTATLYVLFAVLFAVPFPAGPISAAG